MASVELVQPHDSTWLMPRSRSEIEISLGQHADDRDRDGVGRDLAAALDEEIVVLPLADVDAAAAAADDDAGFRLAERQAGVDPGFARRDHADQRGA